VREQTTEWNYFRTAEDKTIRQGTSCSNRTIDPGVALKESVAAKRLQVALTHPTDLNRISGDVADCVEREFKELLKLSFVRNRLKDFAFRSFLDASCWG